MLTRVDSFIQTGVWGYLWHQLHEDQASGHRLALSAFAETPGEHVVHFL